jgi:hypothetical protein
MIVPGNMSEVAGLIGTAMALLKGASGEVDERFKSHAWKACVG